MCVHSIGFYTYRMMPSVNKKFCFFLFNLNAFNLGAFFQWLESTARCCSVAKSRPTLCSPTDSSTPGFPVLHTLLSLLKLMPLGQ